MISSVRKSIQYFRLLKPPAIKFADKVLYLFVGVLTVFLVLPYSFFTKRGIKTSLCDIFPKLIAKDILITFRGVKFIARKRKNDIWALSELSEPWMTKYFKPKEDEIVLDVGVHVGKYALYGAKFVGDKGAVIAIEASSENFLQLKKNIKLNGFKNIIALNYAAFNCNGKKLRLQGNSDGGLSVKRSAEKNYELIETVETKTIDTILEETSYINNVSCVKIDVESSEVEVLEGMRNTIRCNPKGLPENNLSNF